MSFSPQILLSKVARDRCITNLKELPMFMHGEVNTTIQHASVLVPLCDVKGEMCLLYTLRSSNLKNHSGQISFPGGKIENCETEINAALRETHEEIGFNPKNVEVWEKMPPVQGRNKDMMIHPIVGVLKNLNTDELKPCAYEVEDIFTVPIKDLCNVEKQGHFKYEEFITPVYLYDKYKIWGITGMITHLFLQCFLPDNLYTIDFMRKTYELNDLMPSKL